MTSTRIKDKIQMVLDLSANESKENSPGRLIAEEKRRALIASCPVRKAGKQSKKYCATCPLKPWCNPDKKEER